MAERVQVANMPHKFRDRDVKRVIRAARAAGLEPVAVEVDPLSGRITVTTSKSSVSSSSDSNPWDAVHAANAKRTS
jgi:hypothetical protein